MTINKLIGALLLSLTMLQSIPVAAQENCTTVSMVNDQAANAGMVKSTELTGSAAKQFIQAWGQVSGATEDEIANTASIVGVVAVYTFDEVVAVTGFGLDGCLLGVVRMPQYNYETIIKTIEQKAQNNG